MDLQDKADLILQLLCYLDVETMRALSAYDVRWTAVANRSEAILTDSRALMSSELPLYRASYTPAKDMFSNAAAHGLAVTELKPQDAKAVDEFMVLYRYIFDSD